MPPSWFKGTRFKRAERFWRVSVPVSDSIDMRAKFLGGTVGTGLGDAIGEMAFRHREREGLLSAVERSDELVYTDDTAMAIGLAESLAELGRLNQEHVGDRFRANYVREPWRGYASGPPTVFARVRAEDISYMEAAKALYRGDGSYGNGAAMRIAPLGLFYFDASDLDEKARRSAAVTHAHRIGRDGAAVQARAVAQAVRLSTAQTFPAERFLRALLNTAQTEQMKAKLLDVRDAIREGLSPREAAGLLGQGVAVHQSLPFAIYAFVRHAGSFEDCLLCATLNGGDRDTLGAMACAVSGAYLGVRAIPGAWRDKLENLKAIERLALRLADIRVA